MDKLVVNKPDTTVTEDNTTATRIEQNTSGCHDCSENWREEIQTVTSAVFPRCRLCEGFYGPNFYEPTCSTCHMFIFQPPELIDVPINNLLQSKNEEYDSGNDDPESASDSDEPAAAYRSTALNQEEQVLTHHENLWRMRIQARVKQLTEVCNTRCMEKNSTAYILNLPTEVILLILSYLNDIDLQHVANTCTRWTELVDLETTDEQWEEFVKTRWPLFKPFYRVESWRDVHMQLLTSAPCQACMSNTSLALYKQPEADLWRSRRLNNELTNLRTDPPEGIIATPLDSRNNNWQAKISGPKGSPYEGGTFYLSLQIPRKYPLRPPHVKFITRVFHPNVSFHGNIGLDSIHENWSSALTFSKILLSIQSLLTDPYLLVCMEASVSSCYKEDRPLFNKIAQLWTQKYAMVGRQNVHLGYMDRTEGYLPLTTLSV